LIALHVLEMNTVAQLVRLTLGTPWATTEDTSPANEENRLSSLSAEPVWAGGIRSRANRFN